MRRTIYCAILSSYNIHALTLKYTRILILKFISFIFSLILITLGTQSAWANDIASPDSNIENNAPVALTLDHDLSETPLAIESEQITTQKPTLRVKLRMSKTINNFDALNNVQSNQPPNSLEIKEQADNENTIKSQGGVIVEGDRLEEILDKNLTIFGNGSLKNKSTSVTGERIEFDFLSHEMSASGNAEFVNKDFIANGPELHLNLDENTGEMPNPIFTIYKSIITAAPDRTFSTLSIIPGQSVRNVEYKKNTAVTDDQKKPQARGTADMLYFEGETKKRLINAKYTTCSTDSDDWYINSKDLEIDTEANKATAKNASIDFKNVPILYTPWMSFPYANQRQSGFINPTMGSTTSSGFELDLPIYWNISPDMDATETNRYLSKRGLQLNGEFRYLLDTNKSYGVEEVQYLASDNMTHKDRYLISSFNKEDFGNGMTASLNYTKVSDTQYFSDLSTQILVTSQVNLPQQFTFNYNKYGWQFGTVIEKFQNLDLSSYAYERLPQISLNRNDSFDWGKTTFQNQYTEFQIDPLATNQAVKAGSRFLSQGSASYPMNTAYGFITPKIGFNYANYNLTEVNQNYAMTQYGNSLDQSSTRALPIFSLDSGLFFEKESEAMGEKFTQTLEPRLFYVYIPYEDQSRMPVFDTGLADLNMGTLFTENQYVGGDRVNNANQLSAAITSNIIDSNGKQILGMMIGERFYFDNQRVYLPGETLRSGERSDIVAAASANLENNWKLNSALDYNTDNGELIKGNIGLRYNPTPGKSLNLSYRYTQGTLNEYVGSTQWPIGSGYYALANLDYSVLDRKPVEIVTGIEYDAGCWQSRFVVQRVQTATAQANYAFFYQLVLGGMTSIGTSPLDLLHRTITGYKNPSLISDDYRQENNE